jgi:hypothetical protein
MKKELDEQLCKEFPNLYKNRHGKVSETCMAWGFECDDGWFDLIYEASKKLEDEILKLPEDQRSNYAAAQVKSKFATLRLYMDGETPEMSKIITEAENKSAVTCEACGKPGKQTGKYWITTLCNKCEVINKRRWEDINRED